MVKTAIVLAFVVLASLSAACGDNDNPASPSTTTPRKAVRPVPAFTQEINK